MIQQITPETIVQLMLEDREFLEKESLHVKTQITDAANGFLDGSVEMWQLMRFLELDTNDRKTALRYVEALCAADEGKEPSRDEDDKLAICLIRSERKCKRLTITTIDLDDGSGETPSFTAEEIEVLKSLVERCSEAISEATRTSVEDEEVDYDISDII